MCSRIALGALLIALEAPALCQQHEHHPPSEHGEAMAGEPLGIPHARLGSGTAWQPDSTPMYAIHTMAGGWALMTHGNIFAGYDAQGSDRGDGRFISINWLMLMASHQLAGGTFEARVMASLDPLTVGARGYPLLLQTGESYQGQPLHDRQHPHDLLMELAVLYSRPLNDSVAFQVYIAPAGEPALGPVAFPHRLSAFSDPLAPLGHHWQDSTHISFGVVTAGLFTRQLKVEGSWFNGREPDENRYDLDLRVPDSFSGRVSWNPLESLSLQVSYGSLKSPEALEPGVSVQRLTASITHDVTFGHDGNWATTLAWGRNVPSSGLGTDAVLLESNLEVDGHHVVFGRAEYVRKNGHDLLLPPPSDEAVFNVGAVSLGYLHDFGPVASLVPALGVLGMVSLTGEPLRPFYGTTAPLGGMVFLRVRPARMTMEMESRTSSRVTSAGGG